MEQVLYNLPDGWNYTELAALCKFENGDRGRNYPSRDAFVESGIPVINAGNLDGRKIVEAGLNYITRERYDILGSGKVRSGDLLFCLRGSLGKCAIVSNLSEGAIASSLVIVRPSEALDPNYLLYYFNSSLCSSFIERYNNGSAQPNLSAKSLSKFLIPLAPIEKQKCIVEKLDALLTRIDTAIEHLQGSITLTDALSKSSLSEIFDGLKNCYEVVPLSSVVKINSGIALPQLFKNGFSDGDIPFFKVAQMNNHHENMIEPEITFNEKIAKEHKIKLFPKGSTLIPKRGGAILTNKKRVLLEDASYDSNIMGLKADEAKIADDYLFAFMRTIDLANFVDASTIPQVNNKHIDQMQIPLASQAEQAKVVNRVDSLVKKVEAMNFEIKNQLNDLLALKNSILDSAFKGEL